MDKLLQDALLLAEGLAPTPANLERVAAATSTDASREGFTQWELRRRASQKFERASEMLFGREALEQATHEALARYHAFRYPVGVSVVDLTVGIGADLIALAQRGPARGYEVDPTRARCARHNLDVHGVQAEVVERDCLEAIWNEEHAWADPSRRVSGVRTFDPDEYEPRPLRLAERMRAIRLGGIKLSPMLDDAFLDSLGAGVEFVSFGGECREAVVWLGADARVGRRAVLVEGHHELESGPEPPATDELGGFLLEADPAAIRAHALGTLCAQTGYRAVGASNGYLTGDRPPDPGHRVWLRCWEVLETVRYDRKHLRAALRRIDARIVAVKVRGLKLDVRSVQQALRTDGARPVILSLFPTSSGVRGALLKELDPILRQEA